MQKDVFQSDPDHATGVSYPNCVMSSAIETSNPKNQPIATLIIIFVVVIEDEGFQHCNLDISPAIKTSTCNLSCL